jgi:hypothetical protein
MSNEEDELAALRREVAALKREIAPANGSEQEAADWRAKMHALHEARMGNAGAFSASDLRAMEAATPRDVCRDIAAHGTVPQPSGFGVGEVSRVSSEPGLPGSGWVAPRPIGPPDGIGAIDRIAGAMAPHGPMNPLNPLAADLRAQQAREEEEAKKAGK